MGWPLVGREDELGLVADALAGRGDRRNVVLAGAPGVGKTRLAKEALARCEAEGLATRWTVATRSSATIPFGALLAILPDPPGATLGIPDLARWARDVLIGSAGGQPLVLAVDNGHLLDEGSAALLHLLAAGGQAAVLVTVVSGSRPPDAVTSLWKDELAVRVDLQALNRDEFERLVGEALAGQVDGRTLALLWDATRGNALYLREVLLTGRDLGALAVHDGVWRWSGPMVVGTGLHELIADRVEALGEAERRVVELVALGEPLGAAVVESLTSADALDGAGRRGLLTIEVTGRRTDVRLVHPLYAEAIRASIPAVRARRLRDELSSAIEAAGTRRPGDTLRVATWRLEAGSAHHPALLVEASKAAVALHDPELGRRLAEAAALAGDATTAFTARRALADSLYSLGRFDEIVELLPALDAAAASDRDRASAADLRAVTLCWGLGRAGEAMAVLRAAIAEIDEASECDYLRAQLAAISFYAGNVGEAVELARGVLERNPQPGATRLIAQMGGAAALCVSGANDEAMALLQEGLPLAMSMANEMPFAPAQLLGTLGLTHWLGGRFHEAEVVAESLFSTAAAQGADEAIGILAMARGAIALYRGRVTAAAAHLTEAASRLRELDIGRFLPWTLALLTQAHALRRDVPAAARSLADARAVATESSGVFLPDLELAAAWLDAAQGELSAARRRAKDAADDGAAHGQFAYVAVALHDVVRLGGAHDVAADLNAVSARVGGGLAPLFAKHATALAADDADALDSVSEQFEGIGALLMAAEAAREASVVHSGAGRRARASAASARADRMLAECEGASSPASRAVGEGTVELTRREREVAEMAARGLTTPEIADRLVVSPRTVETHLYRAFGKLGVTTRAELRSVFAPEDT